MRLLLDTDAFLWWVFADPRLSRQARTAIAEDAQNDIFVSAASAWGVTTKFAARAYDATRGTDCAFTWLSAFMKRSL